MRAVLLLLAFAASLTAANLKLYTTDGEYQLVREYKVEGDRVKFYSIERSDWEEVPATMVDLKRTEAESSARNEVLDRQAKELDEESAAARAQRAEIAMIPKDSGAYRIENGQLRTLKVADITVRTAKGRSILQVLSPLPVIEGKATVEIAGERSANIVHDDRPEFFFQMDKPESLGIIRITPQKGVRIAEHVALIPITKETLEERESIPIFTKQLPGDDFYKIWPQEPLPKGEYGVIEYLEGKVDLRIWDFRIE
jgi:hypothetical protein